MNLPGISSGEPPELLKPPLAAQRGQSTSIGTPQPSMSLLGSLRPSVEVVVQKAEQGLVREALETGMPDVLARMLELATSSDSTQMLVHCFKFHSWRTLS
mmetsp:Transcript_45361/g.105257  ORF Transcript_45361/g.105257 Transcript_45361/m.105257 type:complete len:100 (+) Transcript_45361:1158-1457(+)